MATIALSNQFYKSSEAEDKYQALNKKYTPDDQQKHRQLFALVIEALETKPADFLGEIYMTLIEGMQANNKQQFFTPFSLCEVSAKAMFGDFSSVEKAIKDKGYITLSEPASGSGAMIIATRNLLAAHGYGTDNLYVVTNDISAICYHMTYIQLSLLGIVGQVCWGNTITGEIWERMMTAPYFFSRFPTLFRLEKALEGMKPTAG